MQFTSRLLLFMLFALGLPIVGYMADKSVKTLPPSGKVDYSKASIQELLELAQPLGEPGKLRFMREPDSNLRGPDSIQPLLEPAQSSAQKQPAH